MADDLNPASRLINLDKVVSPDLEVVLNETSYRLPGDPPSEDMLMIGELLDKLQKAEPLEDVEAYRGLRRDLGLALEDLFRIRQPELPEGTIDLSDKQLIELVNGLFGFYFPDADEDDAEGGGSRPTSQRGSTPPKRKNSRPSGSRRKPTPASTSSASLPT